MVLTGLTAYRESGLLILRLGIGIAFIFHGFPKLAGGPGMWEGLGQMVGLPVPVFFGFLAACIEFFGGILFALGVLFRPVSILLLLQMLAALWFHIQAGDDYSTLSHPMKMAIVFLALILIGPGKYSVDKR